MARLEELRKKGKSTAKRPDFAEPCGSAGSGDGGNLHFCGLTARHLALAAQFKLLAALVYLYLPEHAKSPGYAGRSFIRPAGLFANQDLADGGRAVFIRVLFAAACIGLARRLIADEMSWRIEECGS
jgi:hypothetical protein